MTPLTPRSGAAAVIALSIFIGTARAQSLDTRLKGISDGTAQFVFASRAGVCGDGEGFIRDSVIGASRLTTDGGNWRHDEDADCRPGPVRVAVTLEDAQVMHLRTFAGPVPSNPENVRDLGRVGASEAVRFLSEIAEHGSARVAGQAMLPLILADSTDPWPELFRVARDPERPSSTRRSAAFWLSRGAAVRLGVADRGRGSESGDDGVRASAVFAISRQPREDAVPRLLELARTAKYPDVRNQALFWLGQSGDPRAIDLFAEILR